MNEPVAITGIWLRGGENSIAVLVEIDGNFVEVITESMPTRGNEGNVWPISHIVEPAGIRRAVQEAA